MRHTLFVLSIVCFALPRLAAGAAADPAPYTPDPVVLGAYEDRWGAEQRNARDANARAALAERLVEEADRTGLPQMRMLLWHKAYEIGRTSPHSYRHAADALDHIQRTDPEQRIWALERLADLIYTVYKMAPHKLHRGVRYFEVQQEIAAQRAELVAVQFETGRITSGEAMRATREAIASLAKGAGVLSQCIARAERDARRSSSPSTIRELTRFVGHNEPRAAAAQQARRALEADQRFYTQLNAAERAFKANPSPATAERLAMTYLTQFDKPELIDDTVRAELEADLKRVATGACVPVRRLSADDAAAIGRWYADAAGKAAAIEAKQPLLIRARVYLQHADDADGHDAAAELSKVKLILTAAGVDDDQQQQLARALSARLAYQFGEGAADLDPAGQDDTGTTGAAGDGDGTGDALPDPADADANPADAAGDGADPLDGVPTREPVTQHGRPMTTCITCGRLFFAGWGVKTERCESCTSGRPNIFDLDE